MPETHREARSDSPPTMLAWGLPARDARESPLESAAAWLAGGVGLLLWTALALLLTSA